MKHFSDMVLSWQLFLLSILSLLFLLSCGSDTEQELSNYTGNNLDVDINLALSQEGNVEKKKKKIKRMLKYLSREFDLSEEQKKILENDMEDTKSEMKILYQEKKDYKKKKKRICKKFFYKSFRG